MTQLDEATRFIQSSLSFNGETAIILGSGLGHVCESLTKKKTLSYKEIPHYPISTVEGHAGELVSGSLGGKNVLISNGRFHLYEGFSENDIIFPFKIFKNLGIKNIITTNSSGSLNKRFPPGTLMAIDEHIDCSFQSNHDDPKKLNGNQYHSEYLLKLAKEVSKTLDIKLEKGTYCWTLGPMYETPAEISYFKTLGGNAVGMSGVPEIKICNKLKLKMLIISNLTNYAAGISNQILTHEDVIINANSNKKSLTQLLLGIIKRI
jgi:purine-nucleoside phosphorylase